MLLHEISDFESGSCVAQADLELIMKLKMTLDLQILLPPLSGFQNPLPGISGVPGVYVVLGIEPRGLCMLSKHFTN